MKDDKNVFMVSGRLTSLTWLIYHKKFVLKWISGLGNGLYYMNFFLSWIILLQQWFKTICKLLMKTVKEVIFFDAADEISWNMFLCFGCSLTVNFDFDSRLFLNDDESSNSNGCLKVDDKMTSYVHCSVSGS